MLRMTGTLTDGVGFEHSNRRDPSPKRYAASLELMASMALVVCTVVAATVVSIGIARADALVAEPMADRTFAVAALLGLMLATWGWITVLVTRTAPPRD
jgi:hypothetical protein